MNGIRPIKLTSIRKEYIWGTEDWLLSYLHEGYEDVPLLIKKITAKGRILTAISRAKCPTTTPKISAKNIKAVSLECFKRNFLFLHYIINIVKEEILVSKCKIIILVNYDYSPKQTASGLLP